MAIIEPNRATSGLFKDMNKASTMIAASLVVVFVAWTFMYVETANVVFNDLSNWIKATLKWYYIAVVAFFLFFTFWLAMSRYGNVRLGADTDRPAFSNFSWLSMLFGAGMGIGLVFWSIAEPIYHFDSNPFVTEGLTSEAATTAMRITFFHWGLHPWAIYVIVALCLCYFAYRKNLPLTISSALYPIIGDRVRGPIGNAVNILAVFATVFGVATSLGFGVQQLATGIFEITGIEFFVDRGADGEVTGPATISIMVLILVISLIAIWSVVSGVDKGIRILSELNMWMALSVIAFMIIFGPTLFLLGFFLESVGDYLANVIPLSLWNDSTEGGDWQGWWTAFYWAWWISWAPFVSMFIARISKGRTIREFIVGVLLIPTILGMIWLTAFGGTALWIELFHTVTNEAGEVVAAVGQAGIVAAVKADVTQALYTTFGLMDAGIVGSIFTVIATVLIATFFVTSSDSGTLVITTILSDGDEQPPIKHRVFWGMTEAAVAAVLILAGGLGALQTAAIATALPFSVIILMMMWGFVKALQEEDLGPQFDTEASKATG